MVLPFDSNYGWSASSVGGTAKVAQSASGREARSLHSTGGWERRRHFVHLGLRGKVERMTLRTAVMVVSEFLSDKIMVVTEFASEGSDGCYRVVKGNCFWNNFLLFFLVRESYCRYRVC